MTAFFKAHPYILRQPDGTFRRFSNEKLALSTWLGCSNQIELRGDKQEWTLNGPLYPWPLGYADARLVFATYR